MGNKQSYSTDAATEFCKAQLVLKNPSGDADTHYNNAIRSKRIEERIKGFDRAANEYRMAKQYARAAVCFRLAAYNYDLAEAAQDFAEKLCESVRMYVRDGSDESVTQALAMLDAEVVPALEASNLGKLTDATVSAAVEGTLEAFSDGRIDAAAFAKHVPVLQELAPPRQKAALAARVVEVYLDRKDYKRAARQYKEMVSAQTLDLDSQEDVLMQSYLRGFLCLAAHHAHKDEFAAPEFAAEAMGSSKAWKASGLRTSAIALYDAATRLDYKAFEAAAETLSFSCNAATAVVRLINAVREGMNEARDKGKQPVLKSEMELATDTLA